MDPLSGVASVVAVIELTRNIVQICGKYLHSVKHAKEEVQRFQDNIIALSKVLQSLDELHESIGTKFTASKGLNVSLTTCFSALKNLEERIDPETTQRQMRKWGLRAFKWPLTQSEMNNSINELEKYKTTFSLSLQVNQMEIITLMGQEVILGKLRTAKGAAFDSYDNPHGECLPGTRIDLLQEIEEWTKSLHEKHIFWLNGMAGTGKSTISRTVAGRLKEQQLLGASFFFKRGEEDRGTARRLFSTLVEQLVITIPQIVPKVRKAIEDDPRISEKALREQFEKLLRDPLLESQQLQHDAMAKVIVIDALDECDREDDIKLILRLLSQLPQSTSIQLRFFLTSRPELPIDLGFQNITNAYKDLILHEIPEPVIERDISLYFEHQLSRIKQEHLLPSTWPGEVNVRSLTERAVPLFIAAATLCLFIGDTKWDPQARLEAILGDPSIYVSKLDSTYTPVLKQLLTGQNKRESQRLLQEFKDIVGVVIVLETPLSINALSQLLDGKPHNIKRRLDQIRSVLSVPDDFGTPVRLLHLSFRDFLVDPQNSEGEFWIDERSANQYLIARCLQTMWNGLKKNICNVLSDGTQWHEFNRDSIPAELQYACRYWAAHLEQSHNPVKELVETFSFLKKHFLHWLEAMCILGYMSEVVVTIKKLESLIQSDTYSEISEFLLDARRFVLKHRQMAETAPLQLYSSGLMFSPESSIVRKTFADELETWKQLPRAPENWSAELQTLEGHSNSVRSVAFSSNGQVLASGSHDHTIRLWDANTGELRQTLEGHSRYVNSVTFSPNGQVLASGSDDCTIRLWDANTGELRQTIEDHSSLVRSVAFSSNGQVLASGSDDHTVRLWDTNTGELRQILEGHSSYVNSVTFSPNSQLLASGSDDHTIRLWDANTGELHQTIEGHSRYFSSVAFSPNGQLLVARSDDCTIRLWDANTGELRQAIEGHSRYVSSVTFSPNGQVLASGSFDETIRLWDVSTGELRQILEGHSDLVWSVAFSSNGQVLASGSDDHTVRLWDTNTGELRQTLEGYSSHVQSVAFSSNGQVLASGSYEHTIRLWDANTGELRQILEGHSSFVNSVTFSPNSQLLASGSDDHTIRLWDANIGELRQTLEGHSDSVLSVTFSPNGQLLASGSSDETIRLWNTKTGELRQILETHPDAVWSMSFSPNGQLLASGSFDETIRLWDANTGERRQSLEGHSDAVWSVAFSPNGQVLASGSDDHTVRLWDAKTGELRQTLEGHSFPVWSEANVVLSILDKQWIYFRDRKMLWLPPDFRPLRLAFKAGTLVLGHSSGRVSFMSSFV